ncbi:MerR family transcriptional regulator [Photorhabdus luminescens]|nr:MerR family transcriptional regulator [Photorhabdus luminescens]
MIGLVTRLYMRIKEFSRKTGVSERMIRYYEKRGLLEPNRTLSGYRNFNSQDLIIVRIIQSLQQVGLTLDVIRILIPWIMNDPVQLSPYPLIISTLKQHREKIKENLKKKPSSFVIT